MGVSLPRCCKCSARGRHTSLRPSPGHCGILILAHLLAISDHLRPSPGPGPASSAGMRSRTGAQSRSGESGHVRARGVAVEQPARDAVGVERVPARERNDEVLLIKVGQALFERTLVATLGRLKQLACEECSRLERHRLACSMAIWCRVVQSPTLRPSTSKRMQLKSADNTKSASASPVRPSRSPARKRRLSGTLVRLVKTTSSERPSRRESPSIPARSRVPSTPSSRACVLWFPPMTTRHNAIRQKSAFVLTSETRWPR